MRKRKAWLERARVYHSRGLAVDFAVLLIATVVLIVIGAQLYQRVVI